MIRQFTSRFTSDLPPNSNARGYPTIALAVQVRPPIEMIAGMRDPSQKHRHGRERDRLEKYRNARRKKTPDRRVARDQNRVAARQSLGIECVAVVRSPDRLSRPRRNAMMRP